MPPAVRYDLRDRYCLRNLRDTNVHLLASLTHITYRPRKACCMVFRLAKMAVISLRHTPQSDAPDYPQQCCQNGYRNGQWLNNHLARPPQRTADVVAATIIMLINTSAEI